PWIVHRPWSIVREAGLHSPAACAPSPSLQSLRWAAALPPALPSGPTPQPGSLTPQLSRRQPAPRGRCAPGRSAARTASNGAPPLAAVHRPPAAPPGVRAGSHGVLVRPNTGLPLWMPISSADTFVLPSITAPPPLSRAATVPSSAGTYSASGG